jgi:hypothetical protein
MTWERSRQHQADLISPRRMGASAGRDGALVTDLPIAPVDAHLVPAVVVQDGSSALDGGILSGSYGAGALAPWPVTWADTAAAERSPSRSYPARVMAPAGI